MKAAFTVLVLNFLLCIAFFFENIILGGILLTIWIVSAIGLIGFYKTKRKGFSTLAYIGFAPFMPIGLLAIFGIRKSLEEIEHKKDSNINPLQVYNFSKKYFTGYLITGIVLSIAHIVVFVFLKINNPAGSIGFFMIIFALIMKKTAIITTYTDHFIYKPSILSIPKKIFFNKIIKNSITGKKLILEVQDEKKAIVIRYEILNRDDFKSLVQMIDDYNIRKSDYNF